MESIFLSFWNHCLMSVADFLMVEPVCYFTGLIILAFVAGLFRRICNI